MTVLKLDPSTRRRCFVMSALFDPYHEWLGILPQEQPPNYYRLLGVAPFEADPDVIRAAADAAK